jgi:hypothetical protein
MHKWEEGVTCRGAVWTVLNITQKIAGNRFKIAGGKAGMEVSGMVTGIGHDPYPDKYRIPVEQRTRRTTNGATDRTRSFTASPIPGA